jgi:acyl-CoA hydrolase
LCYDAKCLCSKGLEKNKCGGVTHVNVVYISVSKRKKKEKKIETEKKKNRKQERKEKKKVNIVLFEFNKCV